MLSQAQEVILHAIIKDILPVIFLVKLHSRAI